MAKLGFTIMSVIAMAVTAASCGGGDRELLTTIDPAAESTASAATGYYAEVNGLHMYYETHGEGEPVVLLRGAYMSAKAILPSPATPQPIKQ